MTRMPKMSDISAYFAHLMKQYQELQKQSQQPDSYRIVDIAEKNGKCTLTIQVIGKNIIFKAAPDEITGDDNMMDHFSRQDVRTITFFACQEIKKPKYKVLLKEFCGKLNKMVFSLRKKGEDKEVHRTAEEISQDEELLNNLSQKEAHLIGYTAATEKASQDLNEKQALHDIQIPKYEITEEEHSEKLNTTIYTLRDKVTKKTRHISSDELQNDINLLKGLDKKDIHRLGFSSASELHQQTQNHKKQIHDKEIPKYEIISEEYSNTLKTTIYTLKNKSTNEIRHISANELINDKKLLQVLSKKDTHKLGFATTAQ